MDVLLNLKVPIPSWEEQQRISALLSNQLSVVNHVRTTSETQLAAAKELQNAYLTAIFNGKEASHWPKYPLGKVGEIGAGITLGRRTFIEETRRLPYLRVANVKDGYLDLSDVNEIEATHTEITKCRLRYGDILLTEGGDPDKLGRGTFWEEQLPECLHQNHIFRVRFDLKKFSPRFIALQIGSTYGKAYFLKHAKQTTGIATINQKVLAGFPLMVPPLSVQNEIVVSLDNQLAAAERVKQGIQNQLDAINQLPAAILRQAFNGEL
jgi:type I restriction enzyme S subunit